MRILVAEDGGVARKVLETNLKKWGYEIVSTVDGNQAWDELKKEDAPHLVILDWLMPGLTGPELCRKIRERNSEDYIYIILVTARGQKDDILEGFESGADDYLTKPYDPQELLSRIKVGERILALHTSIKFKFSELDEVKNQLKELENLITICPNCQKIKNEKLLLLKLEQYYLSHPEGAYNRLACEQCEKKMQPVKVNSAK